jgi:ABC-2 type transport system ATP-binding protein
VRSYSKGNRQKIALVAAFMSRPDILLLDEPTVGLDPLMQAEFQAMVREASSRGQTTFLSSHLLDEVEDVCHRVAILRAGALVEVATLEELRRLTTTIFEALLREPTPSFADLPEVLASEPMPGGVRVTVAGPPGAVLERLTRAGVERLDSHAPTLEQIFLTYYETTDEQRLAVAAAHGDSGIRPATTGERP